MATRTSVLDAKMTSPGRIGVLIFGIALIVGFIYAGSHLIGDLQGFHPASALPFILLGVALLTALGFEFVNGFHDTLTPWRR
jgi:PiT family inorganic phosphate transporter